MLPKLDLSPAVLFVGAAALRFLSEDPQLSSPDLATKFTYTKCFVSSVNEAWYTGT